MMTRQPGRTLLIEDTPSLRISGLAKINTVDDDDNDDDGDLQDCTRGSFPTK